jgi:PPOX class probable F420-dependent enzyme
MHEGAARGRTGRVQTAELRRLFAASPVARLSTVRPDGGPHVVPMVFALVEDTVYSAVDAKPKRSRALQRLANIRSDPRCALLVDHYEDDWRRLWWVRADGTGEVVDAPPAQHPGLRALVQRFREYRDEPPSGPLLVVTVRRWTGWASTS